MYIFNVDVVTISRFTEFQSIHGAQHHLGLNWRHTYCMCAQQCCSCSVCVGEPNVHITAAPSERVRRAEPSKGGLGLGAARLYAPLQSGY